MKWGISESDILLIWLSDSQNSERQIRSRLHPSPQKIELFSENNQILWAVNKSIRLRKLASLNKICSTQDLKVQKILLRLDYVHRTKLTWTPTLSECKIFIDTTFTIQKWLLYTLFYRQNFISKFYFWHLILKNRHVPRLFYPEDASKFYWWT